MMHRKSCGALLVSPDIMNNVTHTDKKINKINEQRVCCYPMTNMRQSDNKRVRNIFDKES